MLLSKGVSGSHFPWAAFLQGAHAQLLGRWRQEVLRLLLQRRQLQAALTSAESAQQAQQAQHDQMEAGHQLRALQWAEASETLRSQLRAAEEAAVDVAVRAGEQQEQAAAAVARTGVLTHRLQMVHISLRVASASCSAGTGDP